MRFIINLLKDQWIKFFYLSILLVIPVIGQSECLFNCLLYPGTICIDGECVSSKPIPSPIPTPSPDSTSEIRIALKPANEVVCVNVDCSKMNMKEFKVYATRMPPPPAVSFYSCIISFYTDLQRKTRINYFFARKDILNKYRLVLIEENQEPQPQFEGVDFAFHLWRNTAFDDFIQNKTCEELKKSGYYFHYGISVKGDRSDFEAATFTFR